MAVRMLPGTELAFEQPVTYQITSMFRANTSHTVAIFRQINKSVLHIHHDALEFPDGEIVLRTRRKRPSGDTPPRARMNSRRFITRSPRRRARAGRMARRECAMAAGPVPC